MSGNFKAKTRPKRTKRAANDSRGKVERQSAKGQSEAVQDEVERRFGVLPNFFRLTPDNPEITASLWGFARFAYLDSPLPSLFKERLFVYLSRFCDVRYCITRHVGFLIGLGRASGDAQCPAQSAEEIIRLIRRPFPRGQDLESLVSLCASCERPLLDLPDPDSPMELAISACASHAFLQTPDAPGCIDALKRALGKPRFQYLMVFLAFVRTAHYWTKVHAELTVEEDLQELLATHERLAECLLNDPEAGACDFSQKPMGELTSLREDAARHNDLVRTQQSGSEERLRQANAELAQRLTQLERADVEIRDSRRAALKLMNDAAQARVAIEESEERYGALLAAAPMAVFVCDRDAVIQYYNARAVELWGREPERGVERHCGSARLWLPDGMLLPHAQSPIVEVLQTGVPVRNVEVFIERPDGSLLPVVVDFAALKNAQGEITGAITSFQDITERKRAEAQLDSQRQALQLLAEGAPLDDVLGFLVGVVERHSAEGMLAAITPLDEAGAHFQRGVGASLPAAFNAAVEGVEVSSPTGLCANAVRRRAAVSVHDFNEDVAWRPFGEFVAPYGLRSGWSVPIVSAGGQVLGTFANYYQRAGDPAPKNRELVDIVVRTAAIAIERRRAEEALRASEERLRAMIGQAAVGIILCDCEGRILEVNPRICQILRRGERELLAETCESLTHPDDWACNKMMMEGVAGGTQADFIIEKRYKHGNGSWLWVNVSVSPLRDALGKVHRLLAVVQYIDARKRAEEELRASEEFNRSLMDGSADCVKVLDLEGRLLLMNEPGMRLMEIDDFSPLRGREWKSLWPEQTRGEALRSVERARAGEAGSFLAFCLTAKGTPKWWDVKVSPVRDGEGRVVRLLSVSRDITERKRTETNLAFLVEVSQDLAGLTNIEETMNRLGEKIGRFFGVKQCMFAEHVDEFKTAVVSYGWNAEDAPNLKGIYRMRDFLSNELMAALMTGKQLIVSETQSDARVSAESYGALGIRSFIIVPLVREREWRFQISIIDDKPREWHDDEIELMRELTTRIWTRLERARAEEALRRAMEFDEAVMSNMGEGLYTVDSQGLVTTMNPAAEKLFGWTFDELRGRRMHDSTHYQHPDGSPFPAEECAGLQVLREGKTLAGYEDVFIRKDGSFFNVIYSSAPIRENGSVGGLVVVFRDITERKQAETLQVEQGNLLEMIASGHSLKECFEALTDSVARLRPSARAAVLLANADRSAMGDFYSARLQPAFGAPIAGLPINEVAIGTCGAAIFKGAPITCADIAHSEEWSQPWRELCMAHGILACHSQPVFGPAGKAVASFFMCFAEAREPDAWDRRLAEFGAHITSIVIERDRAAQVLRESEARLAAELADAKQLQRISSQLIREDNINVLYGQIIEAAIALMRSDMGSMQMLHPERNELRLLAWKGFDPASAAFWEWVRVDSGSTCGMALTRGERVIAPDVETCDFMAGTKDLDFFRLSGIRAAQTTPLVSRSGHIVGMISTHWREPHQPSERDLRLLDVLARQAADLIERKQAEQALQRSEERFRTMADNISQFAWMADGRGWIFWYNQRWFDYTGATLEEMQGWGWKKVHHPDHVDRVVERIQRSWDTGEAWEDTFPLRGKDGEYRWFLSRALPIRDERGEVVRWFGTNTDVTEQRQAEQDALFLADLAERIRLAGDADELTWEVAQSVGEQLQVARCCFVEIDTANDQGVVRRDYCRGVESVAGEYRISDYSPASKAEMEAGRTVVNRDSKTDPRTAALYEATYRKTGERAYIAVPLGRARRWAATLWVSAEQPRDWTSREITLLETAAERTWLAMEKIRLDAALRETQAERLAEEQRNAERLRELNAAAIEINAATSVEEIIRLTNEKARELTGARMSVVNLVPDGDWKRSRTVASLSDEHAAWRGYDAQVTGEGIYSLVFREKRAMRMTQAELASHPAWRGHGQEAGKHPPLRGWLAAPLLDGAGESIGVVQLSDKWADGQAGEFTEADEALLMQLAQVGSVALENQQLYEQEQEARQVAEQAARAKDEFLAVVSHELRSPLNAILGWSRLLQSQWPDDPQIAKANEIIERNGQAQLRLIEDLLDTTRIITGKMKLEPVPVELADVISSALDTVRPAAGNKGIAIAIDLDPKAGQITGDPDRLRQVVWNLVSNAVKFTPEGGRVWVELRRGVSGVQIVVRDTGRGISPDLLPYVFDRFKQGDSSVSRRFGGLGLGLALVKHLVELHGGRVAVESPGENQGATFTINLPVRAVRGDGVAQGRKGGETIVDQLAPHGQRRETLSGVRILVVDDEADARELLTITLEQYGAVVTGVDSAAGALAAMESQLDGAAGAPFDMLISDIGMPGLDGYELIRRVRAHSDMQVKKIRAVALTAYARSEDRLRALRSGFEMHVPKPVDREELMTVVAALTDYTLGGD